MSDQPLDIGPEYFVNPVPITILGYTGTAKEPFLTRDGKYLLFNDDNEPPTDTNLYWAERISDTVFQFKGPVQGVNSTDVDAIPSMDAQGHFYFYSRVQYLSTGLSLFSGIFNNGTVTDVVPVNQNLRTSIYGDVDFDSEISPDGQTLYYTDGLVADPADRASKLLAAVIKEAILTPDGFVDSPDSATLFQNINNGVLNFAPAITENGLTLFFTRADQSSLKMYVSTRSSTAEPFGVPIALDSFNGIPEGSSISSDGTLLYFHKLLDDGSGRIYVAQHIAATPRILSWTGNADSDVTDPLNWDDATNSLDPAAVAPGTADGAVFINKGGPISGTGTAEVFAFGGWGTWQIPSTGSLTSMSGIVVGASGSGALTIGPGGHLTSYGVRDVISGSAGGSAAVIVTGAAASVRSGGEMLVGAGDGGNGRLSITNGAALASGFDAGSLGHGLAVGLDVHAIGTVIVSGTDSTLVNSGLFSIGGGEGVTPGGIGTLQILNGGVVTTSRFGASLDYPAASISTSTGSGGSSVTVDGTGSALRVDGPVTVGVGANGDLAVTAGGSVAADDLREASLAGITANVTVSGAGSEISLSGSLEVADGGAALLLVQDGGAVRAQDVRVGIMSGGAGTIDLIGLDSELILDGSLSLGEGGSGLMHIEAGGLLSAANGLRIGTGSTLMASDGSVVADIIDNLGQIQGYGTLAATGAVSNDGSVMATGGTFQIGAASIGGSGTLGVNSDSNLRVMSGVGSGQTVSFLNQFDNSGVLTIGYLAQFMPASIDNFVNGDSIVIEGFTSLAQSFDSDTGRLTLTDGESHPYTVTFAGMHVADDFLGSVTAVLCYAAGTRIAVPDGEIAVERLRPGDDVCVGMGGPIAPVVRVLRRHVDCRTHADPRSVWPVRIDTHAFGPGRPHRDLLLSPNHGVFVHDVLIPVRYLINGRTISQQMVDEVTYHHIELQSHNLVLAEGLAVESCLDTAGRDNLIMGDATAVAGADVVPFCWETAGCALIVVAGPLIARVRQELARLASVDQDGGIAA